MFGQISPSVRNLLARSSEWTQDQKFASYRTPVNAADGSQVSSPALIFQGVGINTATGLPSFSHARLRNYPEAGTTGARPRLRADSSVDGGNTWVNMWESKSGDANALTTPVHTFSGRFKVSMSANNSQPSTLDHLTLENPSGGNSHIYFTHAGTGRGSYSVGSSGTTIFRAAGSGGGIFEFQVGTSILSTNYVTQISSGGVYTSGSGVFSQRLGVGGGSFSVPAKLAVYGSIALKGITVTSALHTLGEEESFAYCYTDTASACTGTPTACNTYLTEGNCNAHTGVGCSWFSGNPCSAYNGDESTCSGTSGCTWEMSDCSVYNGDESTCSITSGCMWDTSTCGSQGDQSSCESFSGCTWNASDCSNFNGTDQGTCEGNSGCTWFDEGGNCSNYFDEGSCSGAGCFWNGSSCVGLCSGQYDVSCSGSFCSGTFATGNCTGVFGSGCQGTAACSNISSSGPCAAEAGCSWSTGIVITMPSSETAHSSNTARLYGVMHIGTSGTVTIQPNSGQTFFNQVGNIALNMPGENALLHYHEVTLTCTTFGSEGACTPTGCSWSNGCTYGTQEECEAVVGCSWDTENGCSGNYSCIGTYAYAKGWFVHVLNN